MKINIFLKGEWSADSYDSIAETWKHCAKWKEPATRYHILYDSIYIKGPFDIVDTGVDYWLVVWGWEEEDGGVLANESGNFFCRVMKTFRVK